MSHEAGTGPLPSIYEAETQMMPAQPGRTGDMAASHQAVPTLPPIGDMPYAEWIKEVNASQPIAEVAGPQDDPGASVQPTTQILKH